LLHQLCQGLRQQLFGPPHPAVFFFDLCFHAPALCRERFGRRAAHL
jgi:hypothetical protein